MLDPKQIRDDPEYVKKNLSRRREPNNEKMVDDFIKVDKTWRELDKVINKLRKKRNEYAKKISKSKGEEKNTLIAEMKQIKTSLDEEEKKSKDAQSKRQWLLDRIPNLLHETVPYGADDSENKEIRTWGTIREFEFEPKDHHQLMDQLNLVEIDRARKTSGARFYYLKNEAVILEMALMRYGLDEVQKQGAEIYSTPSMVRKEILYGTGFLPLGEEDIYKIEGEDLGLIGTSEVTLAGLHFDEVLIADDLPKRYAGLSTCFRTEASAATRDDKGIFRVHEFKKVEMFSYTLPERSWDEQERLIGIAEKIFQGLELPYRVVNICTGDIGGVAARKYDIEVWMPGQQRYREVVSCSNCTDYQTRRLKIRYRQKEGAPVEGFVHTLNSTVVTSTRPIIAILENNQQEDGSIVIPKVLQKYTGFDRIIPQEM
ncbi:MAG: serine--tRNA ligase [Candidatus Kariarchaeaceae archaeon]|jgi:seryl-tRNA synthetase